MFLLRERERMAEARVVVDSKMSSERRRPGARDAQGVWQHESRPVILPLLFNRADRGRVDFVIIRELHRERTFLLHEAHLHFQAVSANRSTSVREPWEDLSPLLALSDSVLDARHVFIGHLGVGRAARVNRCRLLRHSEDVLASIAGSDIRHLREQPCDRRDASSPDGGRRFRYQWLRSVDSRGAL